LTFEPVNATLGAVGTGARLASLSDVEWLQIAQAFDEYAVLVFPDQHLSDEEQRAFGRRFGPLDDIIGSEGVITITNLGADGCVREPDDPTMAATMGNMHWHSDSAYMPVSAQASMLSAHLVPPSGGDTEWADLRAAYDDLPSDIRKRVDGLTAHHSWTYAQRKLGLHEGGSGDYVSNNPPVPVRPLVKRHPSTGRPSLFLSRHAHAVAGLSDEESEQLLEWLMDFACRPPRLYRHQWEVGDLVVWDNRCLVHRVHRWDLTEARIMKHTRVSGNPATESALSLSA
jgi:alpha-ketoglutarate-dependent taurine dioxygenase